MNLNKAIIIGNITRDPELKSLPSGMKVTSFSMVTNRVWKGADGQKNENAEYHNIVSFGKQAEIIAQYCKKGDEIYIEGRIQTRNWEKDGVKHYRTEIVAETFQFGKKRTQNQTESQPEESEPTSSTMTSVQPDGSEPLDMSDIPF